MQESEFKSLKADDRQLQDMVDRATEVHIDHQLLCISPSCTCLVYMARHVGILDMKRAVSCERWFDRICAWVDE